MASKPCASVKDLLSTGYFYEELKTYSSSEIDISTYCKDLAIPYMLRRSDSYEKLGQDEKAVIFKLAIENLSNVGDECLSESVIELKKLAQSTLNTLASNFSKSSDKSEDRLINSKMEAARILNKLIVSMVKVFKLTETTTPKCQPVATVEAGGAT